MSIGFEFAKLKKVSQDTFYQSIQDRLGIKEAQTYMPLYPKFVNFHNKYSKKMFNLKGEYTVLEILDSDEKTCNKLQGKIRANVIKNSLYTKSKSFDDYKNHIVEKEIFIKSNPIVDVIKYMEGDYEFESRIPSTECNGTFKKLNNPNNNAYIEVMGCYIASKLGKKNYTNIFPEYYGCFNGIAQNYEHDISEDYNFINSDDWFNDKNGKEFEIIYDNNLDNYQKLSLDNLEKLDYRKEKNTEENQMEINLEVNSDFGSDIELEEVYTSENIKDMESNIKPKCKIIELDSENNSCSESSDESDSNISEGSWSTFNSNESVLCAEYWVKVKDIPVQLLCMESCDMTLTNLEKTGIEEMEWLSIIFQICFGLAGAQKHVGFIHNDLHSDNIMFKNTDKEFNYFKYDDTFFRLPTFGREIKIIDFARSIFKVKNNIYYSDVFEKNGDAGGQYGNPPSIHLKRKLNYSFDLARLSTTIIEFFDDDSPIFDLLVNWTRYKEEGIDKNFNQLEDTFSLYVTITKYARNAIPKDQLLKEIFNVFRIMPTDIPENSIIYQF